MRLENFKGKHLDKYPNHIYKFTIFEYIGQTSK